MVETLLVIAVILSGIAAIAAVSALLRSSRGDAGAQDVAGELARLSDSVVRLEGQTEHAARSVPQFSGMLAQQFSQSRDLQSAELAQVDRRMAQVDERIAQIRQENAAALRDVRAMVDSQLREVREQNVQSLAEVREQNARSLEQMRATVDERLDRTLSERLAQSFARVDERLRQVDRGLGEMQGLAADVGGLKRVLSNVKTRGILGEVQLGAILKEVLAPSQYDENVPTVPGSSERVEFAVRLPGEGGEPVWLPIDSKFPGDAYEHLRDAADAGDAAALDAAWKALEQRLRSEAADIHDKYVAPPSTTSFGILFLPFEGLYAEVVNRPGLLERLQREYRVNVAGPSTMAALLNSLQMGFQTVAIQRRADEIQRVLAVVKTEFGKYQAELIRAQRQLGTATKTIDSLVGTRTRVMERRLREATELGDEEPAALPEGRDPTRGKGSGGGRRGAHFTQAGVAEDDSTETEVDADSSN